MKILLRSESKEKFLKFRLRGFLVLILLYASCLMWSSECQAKIEEVVVLKVFDSKDKVMVQRTNGEIWLLEYGIGCLSLWRYEGKTIYVVSSGLFAGIGSKIILEDGGECRIWDSEQLE